MISIGELQNSIESKKKRTKEAIDSLKAGIKSEVQYSGSLGFRIIWLGLCFSIAAYMTVRAVMFAIQ